LKKRRALVSPLCPGPASWGEGKGAISWGKSIRSVVELEQSHLFNAVLAGSEIHSRNIAMDDLYAKEKIR
jgi:hypothetical protein